MTNDHEDCFKREHDISAAWARAEDEVKALKQVLDVQALKYNAILDEHKIEFVKINQENAKLRSEIVTWKKYRALLSEEFNSAVGMAVIHGWCSTPEKIELGKKLRAELGIPDSPAPKDNLCSHEGVPCKFCGDGA